MSSVPTTTALSSKQIIVNELHRAARRKFARRRTIVKGLNDLFQADLMEFQPHARLNKQYKFVLVVIDCFSKFVWTRPLKSKSGKEVALAMESIFKLKVPRNLQVDQGKEFYNSSVSKVCRDFKVNMYSSFQSTKASFAERVIRTLKGKIYRNFSLRGNYKWIDVLQDLTDDYNRTPHSAIGRIKPVNVNEKNESLILKSFFSKGNLKRFGRAKLKVGDHVRISKFKSVFAKGYTPNWSTELFRVKKINLTNPVTYKLEDYKGSPILGCFYEPELQKTAQKDVFLVEKVLRRKGDRFYVKWLGFPNENNSWINRRDMR